MKSKKILVVFVFLILLSIVFSVKVFAVEEYLDQQTRLHYKVVGNEITISGVGDIYNINNQIDIQNYKEINKIEKTWSKSLKQDLSKVVKKVQNKYKSDIFGFGNLIYKNNPKTWETIEKDWNSKYFPNLKVKIKTNLKINATGSLEKTIKEAQ